MPASKFREGQQLGCYTLLRRSSPYKWAARCTCGKIANINATEMENRQSRCRHSEGLVGHWVGDFVGLCMTSNGFRFKCQVCGRRHVAPISFWRNNIPRHASVVSGRHLCKPYARRVADIDNDRMIAQTQLARNEGLSRQRISQLIAAGKLTVSRYRGRRVIRKDAKYAAWLRGRPATASR